jgi:hypothetical protein
MTTGCPSDPPQQQPAATIATTSTAAGRPSAKAKPATRPAPGSKSKLGKPSLKPTRATAPEALGTLPDGVGIAVGSTAPDFTLVAHSKGEQSLDALLARGEVLLVFYRGGW